MTSRALGDPTAAWSNGEGLAAGDAWRASELGRTRRLLDDEVRRGNALAAAVRAHVDGAAAHCARAAVGECDAYRGRGLRCPTCPDEDALDLAAAIAAWGAR